jgi:hypothetical protein
MLKEISLFRRLPIELRQMIWRLAEKAPRVHILRTWIDNLTQNELLVEQRFVSQICQESRREVQKLSRTNTFALTINCINDTIYGVGYNMEALSFVESRVLSQNLRHDTRDVLKYLAIPYTIWRYWQAAGHRKDVSFLVHFPALTELLLVFSKGTPPEMVTEFYNLSGGPHYLDWSKQMFYVWGR